MLTLSRRLTEPFPVYNEDGIWNFYTINGYNPVAQRSELGDKSEAKQYRFIFSPYVTYKFLIVFIVLHL